MGLLSIFARGQGGNAAGDLYRAAVVQARREQFYRLFGVSDSVDGRFDLVTLHVFLLLQRLGAGGRPAKALSQAVFDAMFADMDANLREMGVSDLAVGGRIKTMAQAFFGRVAAYEPGLAAGIDGMAELKEALMRNLYRGGSVEDSLLTALAAYVQRENAALAEQSLDDLLAGKVRFGEPPSPGPVRP